MRIVGGRLKGRSLAAPSGSLTRPTTDRTREALFNILSHQHADILENARVLDLFAGTGALGLEALSRGASYAHFVENNASARAAIRTNIETFCLTGIARIYRRDATKLGPIGTLKPFNMVFLDPPYGRGLGELALADASANGWLVSGALAIWEEAATTEVSAPNRFEILDERSYGDTVIRFLQYAA